jgi:hypothetical protein
VSGEQPLSLRHHHGRARVVVAEGHGTMCSGDHEAGLSDVGGQMLLDGGPVQALPLGAEAGIALVLAALALDLGAGHAQRLAVRCRCQTRSTAPKTSAAATSRQPSAAASTPPRPRTRPAGAPARAASGRASGQHRQRGQAQQDGRLENAPPRLEQAAPLSEPPPQPAADRGAAG